MGKREFVSIDGVIEPIKGVVHIQVLHSACSLYMYIAQWTISNLLNFSVRLQGFFILQDYKDTLKGRRVFVQLVIIFRHGREDDETMGLSFKKELILDRTQVKPPDVENFSSINSRSILRKVVPKRVNYRRVSFKN